jgi:hypothetical protein
VLIRYVWYDSEAEWRTPLMLLQFWMSRRPLDITTLTVSHFDLSSRFLYSSLRPAQEICSNLKQSNVSAPLFPFSLLRSWWWGFMRNCTAIWNYTLAALSYLTDSTPTLKRYSTSPQHSTALLVPVVHYRPSTSICLNNAPDQVTFWSPVRSIYWLCFKHYIIRHLVAAAATAISD